MSAGTVRAEGTRSMTRSVCAGVCAPMMYPWHSCALPTLPFVVAVRDLVQNAAMGCGDVSSASRLPPCFRDLSISYSPAASDGVTLGFW